MFTLLTILGTAAVYRAAIEVTRSLPDGKVKEKLVSALGGGGPAPVR
jgi:glycosyltransferase A (GT-A) superfamily protein (DUF2064 family)